MQLQLPVVEPSRTGGFVGVVTELELAVWDIAKPIAATRFSAVLRNAMRADPDPNLPGPSDEVQRFELSSHPALQRALVAESAAALMRHEPLVESEWFAWNRRGLKAMARIASRMSAGIDRDVRAVMADVDNFQPIWNGGVLFDLRADPVGPALKFEGLDSADVREALARVWAAAKATPTHSAAIKAARLVREDRSLLVRWAQLSQTARVALDETLKSETIGAGPIRGKEILRNAYAGTPLEPVAAALRRQNRLEQEVCAAILGFADSEPLVITNPVGTVRCQADATREPLIHLSVPDDGAAGPLRLSHMVRLSMGTPIDGLHSVSGYTMSFSSSAGSYDLNLMPLRWAEGRWFRSDDVRTQ